VRVTEGSSGKKTTNKFDPLIYGHGPIEGITSVSANRKGKATLWIRTANGISTKDENFTPFIIVSNEKLLEGLDGCKVRELTGDLEYRWFIEIEDFDILKKRLLFSYNKINATAETAFVGLKEIYSPNFTEQYLIQSGNTYYKGMKFEDIVRMQIDIETTGLLHDQNAKIFAINIKCSTGREEILHGGSEHALFTKLNEIMKQDNPDVIENHNIFGFDLPFLYRQYYKANVQFEKLARRYRDKYEHDDNLKLGEKSEVFSRWNLDGREIVDTLHSVRRYDANTRELGGQAGLKHAAKFFGFGRPDDAHIDGDKIYDTYTSDREKFLKYALFDVREVDDISKLLHQDKFYLAQMVPMRFQKVATAGTSKMIEYPLVRSYLREGHSLPAPQEKLEYSGGLVELEKVGLFSNAIKIDVASMYPSIILNNGIGPKNDPLNIFVPFLSKLKDMRLEYKRKSKTDKSFFPLQNALKIVINGSYGYLGFKFGLFNNLQGAADTTAIGRKILTKMLESIRKHGGNPIEADTDGIICEYPTDKMSPHDFAKLIQNEISEFKGIEVESESDEPLHSVYVYAKKSYVVFHKGKLKITGSALRSKAMEPLIKDFIQKAFSYLVNRDLKSFIEITKETHDLISSGKCEIRNLLRRTTLQKSVDEYQKSKKTNQCQYEVLINAGMLSARSGFASEFYMSRSGYKHISQFSGDYNVNYYLTKFKAKLKMFRHAFDRNVFKQIIDFNFNEVDLDTPFTNYEVDSLPGDIPYSPLSHYQRRDILEKIDIAFFSLNGDILELELSFENLTVSDDKQHVYIQIYVPNYEDEGSIINHPEHGQVELGQGWQSHTLKIKIPYSVTYERLVCDEFNEEDSEEGIGGLNLDFYNKISDAIEDQLKIKLNHIPEFTELDFQ
jgi:DNA polymerase elongation subunit (family B)